MAGGRYSLIYSLIYSLTYSLIYFFHYENLLFYYSILSSSQTKIGQVPK